VPEQEITPGRRALIAAAGSAVGVVFGALVWLVASQFAPYPPLTAFILDRLVYVNLFWGLINWLPIRPLDGGHLLESLLDKVAPRRSEAVARVVFMATAAIGLVLAVVFNLIFIAILAGLMLLSEMSAAGRPPVGATGFPTLSYEDPAQPNRDALPDERAPALDPPAEPIPDDTDHGGRQGPSH